MSPIIFTTNARDGLSIHLNEILHYYMAYYRACVNVARVLKAHALLAGKRTMNNAMMRAHNGVACLP